MKAAIVKASAIAKHRRMDAGHFLADGGPEREAVRQAKVALALAIGKMRHACEEREAAHARAIALINAGEVRPCD